MYFSVQVEQIKQRCFKISLREQFPLARLKRLINVHKMIQLLGTFEEAQTVLKILQNVIVLYPNSVTLAGDALIGAAFE